MRIDVILNTNARLFRTSPSKVEAARALCAGRADLHATTSVQQLDDVCDHIASRGTDLVILCGGGNKGAAGLTAARHLSNWGFRIDPIICGVEEEAAFMVRRQLQTLRYAGILEPADLESSEITVEDQLADADLVIDALIGYGLEGAPQGIASAVTQLSLQAARPTLALDVPTGVNATTGEVSTPAIRACTTLMLDLPKRGVLELGARHHTGELFLADIGIPRSVHERLGVSIPGVFSEGPIVRLRR